MRFLAEAIVKGRLAGLVAFGCAVLAVAASAPTRLSLEQADSRVAPDYVPAYEGKEVVVAGQVSSRPILITDSLYLPIQDETGYGLMLQGAEWRFRSLDPGDWIEAQGTLVRRGGRPILVPRDIRRQGHTDPPKPRPS